MKTSTALAQQQTVIDIIQTVPQALERNKKSVEKIKEIGTALLARVEDGQMDDALDAEINDEIIKFTNSFNSCYERRAPFFREVENFRKVFTELEKQIDPKVKDSITFKLQAARDKYAAEKAEAEKKRQAEAARKLAKDREAISLRNDVAAMLSQHVNNYIAEAKKYFYNIFETITLETFEKDKAVLAAPVKAYKEDHFNAFNPLIRNNVYHFEEELLKIISDAKFCKYDSCNKRVMDELTAYKAELCEKIPSKLNEVKEREAARIAKEAADKAAAEAKTAQAKTDALIAQQKAEEEQWRLAKEKEERERVESEANAKAKAEADLKAQQAAEANKAIEQTQTLFDAQVTSMAAEAPQVKESYEIEVLNPLGYMQIFQLWFEKEGKNKLPEEIEKKTCKQMKAFCEKWALKSDEKIESKYLIYKEIYKTKAVK